MRVYVTGNITVDETWSIPDIPKKGGWTFIYFIKINNAKEAQKVDSIGIHLTLCSKNTR